MICSCGGIDENGAVSESTVAQCAVKQGMMAQSRLRILVVDHSKIGERRAFRIGSISDFDVLVCDCDPGDALKAFCLEHDVRLIFR
jgi:DeoR/GlpR family transcriptional regulator of sugar metabolism